MTQIAPELLQKQLTWRYAVKRFDPSRRLDDTTWKALENALILTPSSYGLQPWKFFVITDPKVKEQLPAISWNQNQPRDCSHMVVIAARESMDREYVEQYMSHVTKVRGLPAEAMDGYRKILISTIEKIPSHLDWNSRQAYIALGQLMLAAAMLGVDTCPMEGLVMAEYDKLLGLSGNGYRTVVGCAVGYRSSEDSQATAAKVRFDTDALVVRI